MSRESKRIVGFLQNREGDSDSDRSPRFFLGESLPMLPHKSDSSEVSENSFTVSEIQRNLLPVGNKESSIPISITVQKLNQPFEEEPVRSRQTPSKGNISLKHYKGYLKLTLCGFMLMSLAYTIHVVDPLEVITSKFMSIEEGSYLFNVWKKPPVKLYIRVFIFNVTNAKEFLSNEHKKMQVEEVGPYVYSEQLENRNITFNSNNTVSFMPQRILLFEPEMSVGNPINDRIIIPNIPLLGITSMLHNSSMALNLALTTLVSYLDTQPFKDVTVNDFLWGYDEPLVKFASTILPNWINFPKFGLLDRLLDEGNNTVTMHIPDRNSKTMDKKTYSIDQFNGSPGLPQWGYKPNGNRTKCSNVQGTIEGLIYPRHLTPNDSFFLYRKAFCRTLPLVYDKSGFSDRGIPVYLYKMADNAFDSAESNPDNACYCKTQGESCLPSGLSDLSPCYYSIPVAISLPHFLKGDPNLLDRVEGLSPDKEKHGTTLAVQPNLGLPIYVETRVQLNLVVRKTKFSPRVRPFNNMVVPIFWLEVKMTELPTSINNLLDLLLFVAPALLKSFIWFLFLTGFSLLLIASIGYVWIGQFFNNTSPLISKNMKKHDKIKGVSLGSNRYSQVQIIPLTNPHSIARGR